MWSFVEYLNPFTMFTANNNYSRFPLFYLSFEGDFSPSNNLKEKLDLNLLHCAYNAVNQFPGVQIRKHLLSIYFFIFQRCTLIAVILKKGNKS